MAPEFCVFVMVNVLAALPKSGITCLSVKGGCIIVYLSNFVADANFNSINYWGTT